MLRIGLAVLAVGLLGCQPEYSDPGPGGPGPGPGPDPTGFGCTAGSADSCGGGTEVCARTGECLDTSQVHLVKTKWTINGTPADTTSCAPTEDLQITFTVYGGQDWGYAPVPCVEGQFTIDKMPTWYDTVELGSINLGGGGTATIDPVTGVATIDLTY